MENASKALIIAGAILLSILLISLGIMIYNNAKGTINDANIDAESAQAFNQKFSQYAGQRKSGDDMNALVQAIQTNNAANPKTRIKITLTGLTNNTHYTQNAAPVAPTATNPGSYSYIFSRSYKYNMTYTTAAADTAFTRAGYINAVTITLATT